MKENFLLNNQTSQWLFHECAENLPIIDFHNHLNVQDLAAGRKYNNIADLWIKCDPYKHRAMRICGVDESYITGNAGDKEKFDVWMGILPGLMGNPLYDWSILEMKRIFQIDLRPGITDPDWLWQETGRILQTAGYDALGILSKFNVEYASPCMEITDDPKVLNSTPNFTPSLRGDSIVNLSAGTIHMLENITGKRIISLESYLDTLREQVSEFDAAGCRFSDHALDNGFFYDSDDGNNGKRFDEFLQGRLLDENDRRKLSSFLLRFLAQEYASRKWTMQLHIGAQRRTSTRLLKAAGPAGGFAGIGNCCSAESLTRMLDDMEQNPSGLPSVILFPLNPADNALMAVLSGSYTEAGTAGKVQLGTAWWWCDHLFGMHQVFETVASFSVLSTFLGMTTDSRSLLSFVRHEYFRRAFCGWLGKKVECGEFLASPEQLKQLVQDVCYNNVKKRYLRAE